MTLKEIQDQGYEFSGETRVPKKGEYYLHPGHGAQGEYIAKATISYQRNIARILIPRSS